MTDFTAAIDAAAEAMYATDVRPPEAGWPPLNENIREAYRTDARAALTAALPHLRRAFAEEAAKAIEEFDPESLSGPGHSVCDDPCLGMVQEALVALVREMGATEPTCCCDLIDVSSVPGVYHYVRGEPNGCPIHTTAAERAAREAPRSEA